VGDVRPENESLDAPVVFLLESFFPVVVVQSSSS